MARIRSACLRRRCSFAPTLALGQGARRRSPTRTASSASRAASTTASSRRSRSAATRCRLGHSFGLQADGALGRIDEDTMGGGGLHLFTRDPSRYLLGLYGSYHTWNVHRHLAGGRRGPALPAAASRSTGSAAMKASPFPRRSAASRSRPARRSCLRAGRSRLLPDRRPQGSTAATATSTRQASVPRASSISCAPIDSPISLFAKADFGEEEYNRITGGLKIYLGPNPDKSLIARHRTEDPENYTPMFPSAVGDRHRAPVHGQQRHDRNEPSQRPCICPAGTFQPGSPPSPIPPGALHASRAN